MKTKDEIVDWLISNEALVIEIIKHTNARIIEPEKEFYDDFKQQEYEEHKRQILNEISRQMAIPTEVFENIIDNKELKGYINIMKEEVKHEPSCLIYVCTCSKGKK
jgi:virulence-associated protein VagC